LPELRSYLSFDLVVIFSEISEFLLYLLPFFFYLTFVVLCVYESCTDKTDNKKKN